MAKRRKEKDEDEEAPFKLPKFDKEKYLKKERRNIKVTFIGFLFGIVMAIVCFGFWALMGSETGSRWILVLFVGLINAAFIKYIIMRLGIDLTDFTNKNWAATYATYFFSWLIIFIVLVNPPFYDEEAPHIECAVLPEMQEPGGSVIIAAQVTDNVEVNSDDITLEITDPNDNTTSIITKTFNHNQRVVIFEFENTKNLLGEFNYLLKVPDVNGLVSTKSGTFSYDEDTIETKPDTVSNITTSDEIEIEVKKEISSENFRVFYTLNDGSEINIDRKEVSDPEDYETSPEFAGWEQNSNYELKVYVEVSHYFRNIEDSKYTNIVKDTQEFNLTTGTDQDMGEETVPMPFNWTKYRRGDDQAPVLLNYDRYSGDGTPGDEVLLPYPNSVKVPGFELIVFIVSLIAVILIFKYKKKDKKSKK